MKDRDVVRWSQIGKIGFYTALTLAVFLMGFCLGYDLKPMERSEIYANGEHAGYEAMAEICKRGHTVTIWKGDK